jgi:hypothetical protein
MLRSIPWEFKPGDCVVVIRDYWIGEIGFAAYVDRRCFDPRMKGRCGIDYG